nr:BTAD domain-containing putative transcriptional regulator [Mycolicibacterium peregrinum]
MDGAPVAVPGAKPRAILTMLGLHSGSVVPADVLMELLWGDDPPRTAAKALQTHISSLRHTLGDGFVLTEGTGWRLNTTGIDASFYRAVTKSGRDALDAGDSGRAVKLFDEALTLWRGIPELPNSRRGASEKTRWSEDHAALVEDRADALLATGRAAEIVGELEAAVGDAPLRERRWGQLMLGLYRAGRQGEALGAFKRAQAVLADELGVDPGPDLRKLEAAIVAQDAGLETPAVQHVPSMMRAVTFLLTDIEGSTAAWETDADAMALALARHDELVEQVVTSRGGRLIKTRGEGDATFSVFDRPSAAAAAALELQDAMLHEPWALQSPMRIRVALHTGEAELRDGDYFGRAVNRAARLRSLAAGGQILCSGATAELVVDSLHDDVVLADLGMRELRNLARPEHVFELRLDTERRPEPPASAATTARPDLPAVLAGPGPFVGRTHELKKLSASWQVAVDGGARAALIAGEPGVGKTRLAGEWSRLVYAQGAVVLYGRSDEDLGAPYQPFSEALRALVPCVGTGQLRGTRGIEALLPLVPGLTDVLPDLAAPPRADPDTERYALFDAVVALLGVASADIPIVLVLDDLHWAAKPTLLLLRHLLRFGEHARVQVVGTYRSTDLDRSHPLAAMLADLHRDGSADRIALTGLDEADVSTYVAQAGYDDEELAHALSAVTGGNPFFLIEALRHVEESGGHWDPGTLPQGVREAVSRRLSRLPAETNKALAAAAVVGSRFALELVEKVVDQDLVDAFDEACQAGIVIEEPGGRYRFNHAIVRQSLLAELASVRRMRLHQRIATMLENEPGADDELLGDLAHHYFECAWAGNALKAVEYCRRAADQAMARLAYEGAADLYDHALHALEELDDELPDLDDQRVELLVARCEALLAAGDVTSAAGAVSQLKAGTRDSARLAAWATCFDGELSMLVDPERLNEIESAVAAAAATLAELDDAAGEAKAHTVRAGCLARLGRVADCEVALDQALAAARQANQHRLVNSVLAGAPLAALWGPNPVPRAGGRCLDVVRLLRITTDSPAVEATSTRCQAVLEAFRGRAAAARRMIDSARRAVTELGLRHAVFEVEHFAGIVELVLDDPAAAEERLRLAYNGFRRMGLDADTAETAALLARACLLLGRGVEADELCSESERLAGYALKPSIAWRTTRAHLLSRRGNHDEARRVAEEAVAIAERTDALVDHGDACLALATVLAAAGEATGARAAAVRAGDLYERKGAMALASKAHGLLGDQSLLSSSVAPPYALGNHAVEPDHPCVRIGNKLTSAVDREAWDEAETLLAPIVVVESHRKIVGYVRTELSPREWTDGMRHYHAVGIVRHRPTFLAVRGDRHALILLTSATDDKAPGAPLDEFVQVVGLNEEGLVAVQVSFDLDDMDAAVADFEAKYARSAALQQLGGRPEESIGPDTACVRAGRRAMSAYERGSWDEFEQLFAPEATLESRRKIVGFTADDLPLDWIHQNRINLETGGMRITAVDIATRGEHLALARLEIGTADLKPGAPQDEILQVYAIDDEGRIALQIWFDLEDMDAAIAELEVRYAAGEAAPCSQTWSVIAHAFAALNQRQVPPMSSDWVNIDHRRGTSFASGDQIAYIEASWQDTPDTRIYPTVVHRLTQSGAVVGSAARGTSHDGLNAEWGGVEVLIVKGGLIVRCEIFDESDLDTALTKFDELNRPASKPENAATRRVEHFWSYFAARDWPALAMTLADGAVTDDRRRVVNAGVRRGRNTLIADIRPIRAEVGTDAITSSSIATRGERLALSLVRAPLFQTEVLGIVEIDDSGRIGSCIAFDLDDINAAIEELDARYLAGEAADNAGTWSAVAGAYTATNRREMPDFAPDWASIDHRRARGFAPGELAAYIRATWNLTPDIISYPESVHRLNNRGAVLTQAVSGTSEGGFDAEWREIVVVTVEGHRINRIELFDERDLDAALVRFDELNLSVPRPENAASRAYERLQKCFIGPDLEAIAAMLADDIRSEDRRHIVSTGIRRGRDAALEDARAVAGLKVRNTAATVIATRGERLALRRSRYANRDEQVDGFHVEILEIIELDGHGLIAGVVTFDSDDFGSAIKELDARYLTGEAAPHPQTWSTIVSAYAALNRHELPAATRQWTDVDHRRLLSVETGDLGQSLHQLWNLTSEASIYIETVHRVTDAGGVITQVASATSREGFDAEWRNISLLTVDGGRLSRGEAFDETDVDAALARLEELSRPTRRLQNMASQVDQRFWSHYPSRTWHAMAELLSEDFSLDDRRQGLNAGLRTGRETEIDNVKAMAGVGPPADVTSEVIATRGTCLALRRLRFASHDQEPNPFYVDVIGVVEITGDTQLSAHTVFDPEDIHSAFAELDARFLAGEAAAHAHTWSVVAGAQAAFKRHEIPEVSPNMLHIDHRPVLSVDRAVIPEPSVYTEAVHRLSERGAVVTQVLEGTSPAGFAGEWRLIDLFMVEGDLISHREVFDESDLDAALTRFDELSQPPAT